MYIILAYVEERGILFAFCLKYIIDLLFDNIKKIHFSFRDWASLIPLPYSRAMTSE